MSIVCDANKLPEEIKTKAHEYVAKRRPRFRTFGIVNDDVECAWLNGFAFCMEGTVEVKVKQCATCVYADSHCIPDDENEETCKRYKSMPESYSLLKKRANELVCCLEHCTKNELAIARCVERLKELI